MFGKVCGEFNEAHSEPLATEDGERAPADWLDSYPPKSPMLFSIPESTSDTLPASLCPPSDSEFACSLVVDAGKYEELPEPIKTIRSQSDYSSCWGINIIIQWKSISDYLNYLIPDEVEGRTSCNIPSGRSPSVFKT